jgi:Rhodopirellula transposase DDE domain
LEDATAGDPITGLKWTRKTARKLSQELKRRGFTVGPTTVRRLLHAQAYTLRVNRKRLSKEADPHRDRQMRYITRTRQAFLKEGAAVISVETKKKELVGPFRNAGRTWRQQPLEVLATDFPGDAGGKAIPYGIYDLQRHAGYVVVGTSHETAQFAVAAIRTWWLRRGRRLYAHQPHLLIEADGGGANSCRSWLWKTGLQALADECQVTITVSHFPPGASKWNPIEHRLFSAITQNWAGQPLVGYETILKFIRTTTTNTGLQCRACLDRRAYATGRKVTPQQKAQVNLVPHRLFPRWNYTIKPHGAACE